MARPIVAFASTLGTDLKKGERAFVGWMAPRGIVAAATASTFTAGLVAKGIGGAAKILPATFVVIVATVTLYALTAAPAARLLRVGRPARTRPLLVGGNAWVIDLALAMRSAGLEVLMWAGLDQQREQIRRGRTAYGGHPDRYAGAAGGRHHGVPGAGAGGAGHGRPAAALALRVRRWHHPQRVIRPGEAWSVAWRGLEVQAGDNRSD